MSLMLLPALGACDIGCENEVLSEQWAPDGKHVAVIFQRACGATTGFSTQLSVLPAGERLRGGGNVWRADTDNGRVPAGPHGGPIVEVRWLAPDSLAVYRDAASRTFAAEERRGTIRIIYRDRGTE